MSKSQEEKLPLCQESHHHLLPSLPHLQDDVVTRLAKLFKVFGDPTRIRLLYLLADQKELCVCDIADQLTMTQSAISHQLRVLKQMSLVSFRREGKTVYYSLADDHVSTVLAQGLEHVQE